jgi:hypothetical protein
MMRFMAFVVACFMSVPARGDIYVDLELVLAVDVSRSMTPRELEIQRRGYATALTSEEVIAALTSGPNQRIALTYVEWAGVGLQRTVVDWTLIDGLDAARGVADQLTISLSNSMRRTSISAALDHATGLFKNNGYQGLRQVIDISGDGANNMGGRVTAARDRAVAEGITINGLPLMTREGMGAMWHLNDLDLYYEACVIGGPGAFVIPVLNWDEFPRAVQRKLVLELVGTMPEIVPARYYGQRGDGSYDCMIGERIWDEIMNGL